MGVHRRAAGFLPLITRNTALLVYTSHESQLFQVHFDLLHASFCTLWPEEPGALRTSAGRYTPAQ